MTHNKHDYVDALEFVYAIESLKGTSDYNHETFGAFVFEKRQAIQSALRIAQKVQSGEVSAEMHKEGINLRG